MKNVSGKISAFCGLVGVLVLLAALSAFAKTEGVSPNMSGEESREENHETLGSLERFANELTFFFGEKMAAMMDAIADSVESRAYRPKTKSAEEPEKHSGDSPDEFEERLSGKRSSLTAGMAALFSMIMREAASELRRLLREKVMPKLMPQNLLVYHSYRRIRAVV